MSDEADRARKLLESCQMPGYDPEGAETYPAVEDGGVNSIGNALAAAQVLATLAVADELRRSNEDRAEFYREVLDVLSSAKSGDGSPVGSGQPAAASGCQVCGKPGAVTRCVVGPLTRDQWKAHRAWLYQQARGDKKLWTAAGTYADETMGEYFGPCPEES